MGNSMKDSGLTVTDLFCGAGGSSSGAQKALDKNGKGGKIALALNHWKLAIETHNTNFPDTLHECTDISACEPRRYPSTNILIASPECTNHTNAKGKERVKNQLSLFDKMVIDPAEERSRATMWDVPRFASLHNYEIVVIENVVEARDWVQFPAWIYSMRLLGYEHKMVFLNSMFFPPTPQSRDRMYVVFWKKGNRKPDLDFRPKAFCTKCNKDIDAIQVWKNPQKKYGKYNKQYVYKCPVHGEEVLPYYYAAYNIIDWSDLGTKIGERKKPLSHNTERRIRHGLKKYGKDPFYVSNYTPGITKDLTNPLGTITTSDHHGFLTPFIVKNAHISASDNAYVKSILDPVLTQTGRQMMGIVFPWIIEMNKTGEAKPAKNPFSTITAGGINHAVLQFFVENKGMSNSREATKPISTLTTKSHIGIINAFIHSNYGQTTLKHITEPVGTIPSKEKHSIISYEEPVYEQCYYRMIKPPEIKKGMAFDDDYIITGNGKQQVKQLGNAVTPPVMEWLIDRCVKSLI